MVTSGTDSFFHVVLPRIDADSLTRARIASGGGAFTSRRSCGGRMSLLEAFGQPYFDDRLTCDA